MKRLLKNAVLLALVVLAVLLVHDRVRKEREAQTAGRDGTEQTEPQDAEAQDAESMEVIGTESGVTLGRLEENAAGGVRVIVTAEDGTVQAYTFTDVAPDSWYVDAVNFVVSAGLMTGSGEEDLFHPEYGILRESFAAILYRFTNGVSVEPTVHYNDVAEDSWYYDAVNWVTNDRLMTSLTPAAFGVGEFMTCEQTLVCLYRVAGHPETDGALTGYPYASKVTPSGRRAVDWAWKNGLITEVECVWYPTQAISRAQVALLLMRYSAMAENG